MNAANSNSILPPINPYETLSSALWRRVQVLGIGIVVGVVASAVYLRVTQEMWDWELLGCAVCGPITANYMGMVETASFGWVGGLMAVAHPLRPNGSMGIITVVGLAFWFVSGFAALELAQRM
jgi:hypothetical protein